MSYKRKNLMLKDIEKKNAVACNIAVKKYDQAQLALDLLENDSAESLTYIKAVRRF